MKVSRWLMLVLLASFYILALALYSRMPQPMATHWNMQGVVDGYISRFWGMFLLPFTATGLTLFLVLLPQFDPLKANIARFRSAYDWFIVFFNGYLLFIFALTLAWNLGARFDMLQLMVPAIAVLLFAIGLLIERAKRNYFIGIRTPWTLSNDEVWARSHRLGGVLFKIAALITLTGVIWPKFAFWFILGPILLVTVILIVASYVIYRQVTAGKATA